MKYIKVLFSNGHKFQIPAGVIAGDRAKYYADRDVGREDMKAWDNKYIEEEMSIMNDEYELLDWLWNNMNWEDVEKRAERVIEEEDAEYSYKDHWMEIQESESNYEVVEI